MRTESCGNVGIRAECVALLLGGGAQPSRAGDSCGYSESGTLLFEHVGRVAIDDCAIQDGDAVEDVCGPVCGMDGRPFVGGYISAHIAHRKWPSP